MENIPHKQIQKQERTAEWVEQQSSVRYSSVRYDPPPSPTLDSPSTSMSRTSSSTTRTASFSEQSSYGGPSTLKRRGMPPSPSLMNPIPSILTSVPNSTHEQRAFPFPQSPPGTGYPMALQVDPPRVETSRPTRPSLLKKRRPSLVDQVKSFGSASVPWKRDEGSRR